VTARVFILYAIPIGLIIGLLLGGRVGRLAEIRFRWAWLVVGALLVQVVLFSGPVASAVPESLGIALYVASSGMALVGVLANWRIPGVAVVALGAFCNLAAIVANGGYMPTTAEALSAAGGQMTEAYSNSAFVAAPALAPLTDVFAMPTWIPAANVFSLGDVIIGVGVVITIVSAMRRHAPAAPAAAPVDPERSGTPA
jgi:hypothetical protein